MKFLYLGQLKFLAYNLLRKILYFAVRVYQCCISPFSVNSCRYYPSCSSYCRDSIIKFGVVKGCFLTFKRLAKCHPFSRGGFDPVPESGKD
jgi:putative membrane protein insertion efficiency factor